MNPNVCYYNAAKHFKLSNYYLRAIFCALKHPKSYWFLWQNTEVNFWVEGHFNPKLQPQTFHLRSEKKLFNHELFNLRLNPLNPLRFASN